MSWLSTEEITTLFKKQWDLSLALEENQSSMSREDWLLFFASSSREISLTRLKDIWPKLDPKEDLWVWQDFKTRFKTYLRKYPLDLNSKKDQERIHLLYYRSQGNWWVMDQLVPLIPKELRKYGASTNWTISYSIEKINFNNPDINWGEFKNTKSFLNELLGGEVTSMVELKDNYLSYYEPKLKTKIFYKKGLKATLRTGVLGIRLPNYKKKEILRSFLNLKTIPIQVNIQIRNFPLGAYWINPDFIFKNNPSFTNIEKDYPLSPAELLMLRKLKTKADELKLNLGGFSQIITTRAGSKIKLPEFEGILKDLYLQQKTMEKNSLITQNIDLLIKSVEDRYRQLLMDSGENLKKLKGIFGLRPLPEKP